jgi:hypothetical protein
MHAWQRRGVIKTRGMKTSSRHQAGLGEHPGVLEKAGGGWRVRRGRAPGIEQTLSFSCALSSGSGLWVGSE